MFKCIHNYNKFYGTCWISLDTYLNLGKIFPIKNHNFRDGKRIEADNFDDIVDLDRRYPWRTLANIPACYSAFSLFLSVSKIGHTRIVLAQLWLLHCDMRCMPECSRTQLQQNRESRMEEQATARTMRRVALASL